MNLTRTEKLQIIQNLKALANPQYNNCAPGFKVQEAIAQALFQKEFDSSYCTLYVNHPEIKHRYYCTPEQRETVNLVGEHLIATGCIELTKRAIRITSKITGYKET